MGIYSLHQILNSGSELSDTEVYNAFADGKNDEDIFKILAERLRFIQTHRTMTVSQRADIFGDRFANVTRYVSYHVCFYIAQLAE